MSDIMVPKESLRNTAKDMVGWGADVDGLLTRLINAVNILRPKWAGEAQIKYFDRFDNLVPKAKHDIAEVIEEFTKAMRHVADEFETTDSGVLT